MNTQFKTEQEKEIAGLKAENARLAEITIIQQKQIERLVDARDAETILKARALRSLVEFREELARLNEKLDYERD